ncbi:MAG: hypothetical protein K0R92_515 [Lachnospiraceae bacterium]|jgi:hypothetical protein|nr:hypothetical protein [Lachnospiraceae bacterium]
MVDANELVKLQTNQPSENKVKLATVSGLYENGTAKITFFGEAVESQKSYSYLAGYQPAIDDTVLMLPCADTYIIVDRVLLQSEVPIDLVTQLEMQDAIQDFVTEAALTLILTGYALTGHTHSTYSLTGHTHTTYSLTTHDHTGTYAPITHYHSSVRHASETSYNAGLNIISNGYPAFIPSSNNMDLGSSSYKWRVVYAGTGTINTSDKRQKKNIKPISDKYEKLFKMLRPVSYKFRKNQSNRLHIGFIAQEVEKSMDEIGMTSSEFAGFIKAPVTDKKGNIKDYQYGLRYSEFIALNSHMIQLQEKKISKLEQKVNILENIIKGGGANG